MSKDLILMIHPISIDFGAKTTGVYTNHYVKGAKLNSSLNQKVQVYQLEKDAYTLLMRDRTAWRHQKRGFDRRQMIKRLFKLIWCEEFGLEWNSDVQQTISFLLNRRGFSFLTEQYNDEILSQFPKEAYEELPEELKVKENEGGNYNFDVALQDWSKDGFECLRKKFETINKEPKRITSRRVFISSTKELKKYCQDTQKDQNNKKKKSKLSHLSKWILEEWSNSQENNIFSKILKEWSEVLSKQKIEEKIKEQERQKSPFINANTINLIQYLEKSNDDEIQNIKNNLPDTQTEENEIKKSVWDFKSEDFKLDENLDQNQFDEPEESLEKEKLEWKKTHLNHLAFAIYKNLEELKSGGRHRSKYFDEVKNVLDCKDHSERNNKFLKAFCNQLQSQKYKPKGRKEAITVDSLTHLIGHLSNLELKPLRKYFNDGQHRGSDYWCEKRLNKYFDMWLCKQWRVNPEKDKDKGPGQDYDYKKLTECWKTYYNKKTKTGSVIDFWLTKKPHWTIPPYQNNNNRRPPHCQSLIFNPTYLDHKYPQWQDWLNQLKASSKDNYLEGFEKQLKELGSSKKKKYFGNQATGQFKKDSCKRDQKDINARILQFIFDRVKKDDPFNLNEIYSYAKKIKQLKRDKQDIQKEKAKLEKAISESDLPDCMKTNPDFKTDGLFEDRSFLHLVYKYYKLRQRARDGRLFIHPQYRFVQGRGYEDTGRFDDKDCLLTYCNHKPRQKRHQLLKDLAGVLQVSYQKLEKFITTSPDQNPDQKNTDNKKQTKNQELDDKIFNWLKAISGLKTNCERAAQEQKDRRGSLKLDIQIVFGLIYHKEQKQSKPPSEDADKLYSFCQRAIKLCLEATETLYDDSQQERWDKTLKTNPATAVYFLTQINNLVFKDRTGYSNTCVVCSMDNAHRMQMQNNSNKAKAQRLPAISTRLIDGTVMRMARIVCKAIVDNEWEAINSALEAGHKVHIPIITESNRFDFEPDLKALKGKKGEKTGSPESLFQKKEDRIKIRKITNLD